MPGFDIKNWSAVHYILNTGPFGTGGYIELDAARVFVRDKLDKFESLTCPLVRVG